MVPRQVARIAALNIPMGVVMGGCLHGGVKTEFPPSTMVTRMNARIGSRLSYHLLWLQELMGIVIANVATNGTLV